VGLSRRSVSAARPSVTPHKEIPLASRRGGPRADDQAANTLVARDGVWEAESTDAWRRQALSARCRAAR
jgi:hypothetical protein